MIRKQDEWIPRDKHEVIDELYNSKLLPKAFDPNNFNPLLYEFDFYTKSTLVYRVDNTSYLIFIRPRELR